MSARYLVDTSAFTRLSRIPELFEKWRTPAEGGNLTVCPLTELEIFYSARSPVHRGKLEAELKRSYNWTFIPDRVYRRAAEVQKVLTDRGAHRSAGPVDLLVAAVAEEQGMTLLHYDGDFEQVTEVTGQPTLWLAKPGSID
ncbi:PIN domain nuclease [Actinoplanes sp. L3-i22]|uniref:PIN domain nuclease n=1 Tax=Actinoplanes sp. L3-i22 TaxID=2836373 RepID=UPI001C76A82D|nr:PIN domain nuclease [Actinoplanes sp. L3-i22]BCY06250.1 ribonuclease VapC21 [Actinoplanes sp. L3-i22]